MCWRFYLQSGELCDSGHNLVVWVDNLRPNPEEKSIEQQHKDRVPKPDTWGFLKPELERTVFSLSLFVVFYRTFVFCFFNIKHVF